MLKVIGTILVVIVLLGLGGYAYLTYIQKVDLGKVAQVATTDNAKDTNYPIQITGQAMIPNYKDGQAWFVDKLAYISNSPQRGDVILFKDVKNPSLEMAKRVVGLPGEEVEIKEGKVYINGNLLEESYLSQDVMTQNSDYPKLGEKVTIPANNYYLLGDNRPHSSDSRIWGFLPRENILGKVTTCYKNCQ